MENEQKKPEEKKPTSNKNLTPGTSVGSTEIVRYPKSVFFIITNEFCERFTYYGMRTVLALYLNSQLDFSDNTSTVIFHVFIMFCYFFPLLGAIIADSWLGKYKTILYLSIVYATGDIIVSVSAIPGLPAVVLTMIGLVLIATGTGGIKPCVAAFGGDQFVLPQQENHLKKFFSIFYFTINAGSFVSTLLTPVLREVECFGIDTCYTLAFGVPAFLMITAIVVFVSGTRFYKIKKPEGNVIVEVAKCIIYAIKKRKVDKSPGHWLDKAADKYDPVFINDIKAALRVLVLYIPLPFFWALFDQQGSRWTFQASRMNGDIGFMKIQPDQMQVVNPILILAFIPLFETVVYPMFARWRLLTRPLQRLTVGGLLAALSFIVSAIVEYKLEQTYAILPKANEAQVRMYNALPETLNFDFIEPDFVPQSIKSMDYWKSLNIPAKGQSTVKLEYTVKGTAKVETFPIAEKTLTSYIFLPDRVITIPKDDPDKSKIGHPKLMVIYSEPTKKTTVTVVDGNRKHEFVVTKAEPYTKYVEMAASDAYRVLVDGNEFMKNMKMKQGGVYVLIILQEEGGGLKSNLLNVIQPNTLHMLWLIPQFVIITAGEIMFSITGLEFSFTQAPLSMKALLQAAWLLTVAVGNLIVVIIAQSKFFERQLYEFLLFAALMIVDMGIFSLMALRYKYVDVKEETQNEGPEEGDTTEKK